MSDELNPPSAMDAAQRLAAAAMPQCPITDEFLAPNFRKHVDPKAPTALRMMGAKGLVPVPPSDLLGVLFMLAFDADQNVRETSWKTAATLRDQVISSAFRDESAKPPVLGWFLDLYRDKDQYAEMLILNASTPDEAVAAVAAACSLRIAEIIAQNQLRILRHDDIIRELAKNPVSQGALIDGVCDFAVRSGVHLLDVPHMQEARVRLFGPEASAQPAEASPTADEIMEEFKEVAVEGAPPLEERKKLTLSQKIAKMSIAEKIKLATRGNKEARGILLRDANKLVAVAVIRSPRLTDGEVLTQAANKSVNDEVLRIIYGNREWVRQYPIKLALVKNPKVPAQVSMRFLNSLHEADVKNLARDKNVPGAIQMMAKKAADKKKETKKESD